MSTSSGCSDWKVIKFALEPTHNNVLTQLLEIEEGKDLVGYFGLVFELSSSTCNPDKNPEWSKEKTAFEYFRSINSGCVSLVKKYDSLVDPLYSYPDVKGSKDRNDFLFKKYKGYSPTKLDYHQFSLLFQEMVESEPKRFLSIRDDLKRRCRKGNKDFCRHFTFASKLIKEDYFKEKLKKTQASKESDNQQVIDYSNVQESKSFLLSTLVYPVVIILPLISFLGLFASVLLFLRTCIYWAKNKQRDILKKDFKFICKVFVASLALLGITILLAGEFLSNH